MRKVYIMKSGEFYKIGSAKNPQNRLLAFKTGNPEIKLIYISEDMQNAYEVEHQLHKKFSDYSVGGEWFFASDEQSFLEEVKSYIKNMTDNASDFSSNNSSNNSYHTSAKKIMEMLFAPVNAEIKKLENEVREINEENEFLKTLLVELGWEQEDIDALVKRAEESIST